MKFLTGIILLALLNTACGGLKHQKSQASAATEKPTELKKSVIAVTLNNALPAPSPYLAIDGSRYIAIAKFNANEVKSMKQNTADGIVKVGYLAANWNQTLYPAHTAAAIPQPDHKMEHVEYQDMKVFVAQANKDSTESFVLISAQDFEKIQPKEDKVVTRYQDEISCLKFKLNRTGMVVWVDEFYENVIVSCTVEKQCTYTPDGESRTTTITEDQLRLRFPNMECRDKQTVPVLTGTFTNSSFVEDFEVQLESPFDEEVGSLKFKNN